MEENTNQTVKNVSEALDQSGYFQETDAEKIGNITPQEVIGKHEHDFIRKSSREVECRVCHWGLIIDSSITLKEGHLFKGSKRIV